jgi:molybdate transport system substrate-binding protein
MTMDGTAIARVVQHLMGRIAMVTMVTAGMIAAPSAAGAASERLFAAGSLRDAFIVLIAAYKESSGVQLEPVFGPSGKLREQIQRGDVPAVFASAAIEHTDVLLKARILRESVVLARNRLCILAAPGLKLDANRLVDTLLDPAVRVGTSTPGADPSGDYTWEFFRNVGKARPGAFAALDAKALKLTGRDVDPQQQDSPYANVLVKDRAADVFITYCTNAAAAARREPGLTWVRIPDDLNVGAVYGIGASTTASAGGAGFVQFALSAQGRAILSGFGFDGP